MNSFISNEYENDVSRFISEENLIESVFTTCDRTRKGVVLVSDIIEYVGSMEQSGTSNPENLKTLENMSCSASFGNDEMDFMTYKRVMERWIDLMRQDDSLDTISEKEQNLSHSIIEGIGGDISYLNLDELYEQLEKLNADVEKLRKEKQFLQHDLCAADEKIAQCQDEIMSLTRSNKKLNQELKSCQKLTDEMSIAQERSTKSYDKLYSEKQKLIKEKRELEKKIKELEDQLWKYSKTINNHKELVQMMNNRSAEIEDLHATTIETNNKYNNIERKTQKMQEIIEDLCERQAILNEELLNLKDERTTGSNSIEDESPRLPHHNIVSSTPLHTEIMAVFQNEANGMSMNEISNIRGQPVIYESNSNSFYQNPVATDDALEKSIAKEACQLQLWSEPCDLHNGTQQNNLFQLLQYLNYHIVKFCCKILRFVLKAFFAIALLPVIIIIILLALKYFGSENLFSDFLQAIIDLLKIEVNYRSGISR